VPSRLSVLTAELYGREDDTLIAWQRTCTQISGMLEAHHAGERLSKTLALAQAGAVTLEEGCALVKSASADVHYEVRPDGSCNCPDAKKHGVPYKHALAVIIHSRAIELLEPVSVAAAPAAPPTPATTALPRRGRPALRSAPAVPTSAAWQVHEAPTSACFKWRIGQNELLYTFRGIDDAEVLERLRTRRSGAGPSPGRRPGAGTPQRA